MCQPICRTFKFKSVPLISVSAAAGVDYTSISVPLEFPVGSAANDMQCIQVIIMDNNMLEGDKIFTVTLNVISSLVMEGRNTTTTVIISNDDSKFVLGRGRKAGGKLDRNRRKPPWGSSVKLMVF